MNDNVCIDDGELGSIGKLHVFRNILFHLFADHVEQFDIHTGIAIRSQESDNQWLHSRVRGAICIGSHTGVDDIHSGFDSLKEREITHTRGKVSMQVNRCLDVRFQRLNEIVSIIRSYQSCHIFDANAIRAHIFELLSFLHIIIDVIYFSAHALFGQRIADCALKVFLILLNYLHCGGEITEVVQSVKDSEYIDAVITSTLSECFHHVVGIVLIANEVLSAQ